MNLTETIGRLIGLEDAQEISGYDFTLAAPWAHEAPAWLWFGSVALLAAAFVFYLRYQPRRRPAAVGWMAVPRAIALVLLLVILAEPALSVRVTSQRKPSLWMLFDGTESMSLVDDYLEEERAALDKAVGVPPQVSSESRPTASYSRSDYVKALLRHNDGRLVRRLAEKTRFSAFLFDRADGVRSLDLGGDPRSVEPARLAEQLSTRGDVTALGGALADLARRHSTGQLAGVVVLSDFDQNAGPSATRAAEELGVPIFTIGVGPTTAADVSVALQAPPHIKKGERGQVTVTVRQHGFDNQAVTVTLGAQSAAGDDDRATELKSVGERRIVLDGPTQDVPFGYTPEQAGRVNLVAQVEPLAGETVRENNTASRELTVLGDHLRLMYVQHEPSWEWRYVKEVFHRDRLVGLQGFRTFLRSADPRVRQTNELFLTTMSPPRGEFFAYDVIFLGDMPASGLSPRFCQMADEFVRNFGGGLVVIAGPKFGVGQLADTPLAGLLPVKVDPSARIHDRSSFRPVITARAEGYGFMQLAGETRGENQRAWNQMGPIEWYQPVERLHPLAVTLAEHPSHKCADGATPQPIVAVRRVGRGEVVYIGCDEMWRLRRLFGEQYYRGFWGQMLHRLGLSHELGAQKRFVVQPDRRRYQPDDRVTVTVEAYTAEFQPLTAKELADGGLRAEVVAPLTGSTRETTQTLTLRPLRDGVFEGAFPVSAPGEYRLRVTDPVTDRTVETSVQVANASVERLSVVRNVALQQALSAATPGGRTYDLTNAERLLDDLKFTPRSETTIVVLTLWNTWLMFGLIVAMLLIEWTARKLGNLS